jgi:hypothetical protein
MTHQAALGKKPGLLSVPGLCSGLVRMAHSVKTSSFQQRFHAGIDRVVERAQRKQVPVLPDIALACGARHASYLNLCSLDLFCNF